MKKLEQNIEAIIFRRRKADQAEGHFSLSGKDQ